jgi:hypothetical protein
MSKLKAPECAAPDLQPRRPKLRLPAGACGSHTDVNHAPDKAVRNRIQIDDPAKRFGSPSR